MQMNAALKELYENTEPSSVSLSDKKNTLFKRVATAFQAMTRWMHKKQHFTPEMLAEQEPLEMITATYEVLTQNLHSTSVKQSITPELTAALEQNAFMFSGFKIFHESNEIAALLKDETGGFKSFSRFKKDVQKIDDKYNKKYLNAEYNFATASTLSAQQWQNYAADGDNYDLQYRTAADEKVREEHAELHHITLPFSDPFWDSYYPPNGWNCRCTVVQVRKGKYPLSDSQAAQAAGERATTYINKDGQNKLAIFRFNPGKEMKLMPPKHPYLPKGCGNCEFRKERNLSYNPNNPQCVACAAIAKCLNKFGTNKTIKERRKQLKQEAKKLRNKPIVHKDFNKEIFVTGGGIDEFLNQPHKYYNEKNELITKIDKVIKKSEYRGCSNYKDRLSYIFETEINNEKSWIIVRDIQGRGIGLYSISDNEKVLIGCKKTI